MYQRAGRIQDVMATSAIEKKALKKLVPRISRKTPVTMQGRRIPTGPLVSVAHPINKVAIQGILFALSHTNGRVGRARVR